MIKIYPSILSADFVNLEQELETILTADGIHIDVMDGHFVPNLTIGLPVVSRICEVAKLPTDVHLMIENVDRWASDYAATGANTVTFHLEAAKHPEQVVTDIRAAGAEAAIAVKPSTPIAQIESMLSQVQMILVMTVEPGFGGQALMPETLEKVRWLRERQLEGSFLGMIQVDGGVNRTTIQDVARSGAQIVVAGSAVFSSGNREAAISELRNLATLAS
jgi:ribulose-phosphate 3-epimerase